MLSEQAIATALTLTVSDASLAVMQAKPAAAKAGLASGIAASLGVAAGDVAILSTTPNLQGVEITVDFKVESATLSVESITNAVREARRSEA